MTGYDLIALYVITQGVVQVTRLGLQYRTTRRRDLAKQGGQP